jgi:hypothetical protein
VEVKITYLCTRDTCGWVGENPAWTRIETVNVETHATTKVSPILPACQRCLGPVDVEMASGEPQERPWTIRPEAT